MSRVFVAPVSFGLGDLVVSLPVVQAAIAAGARDGDETWLVVRAPVQAALAERIAGLAGTVDEGAFMPPRPPDRLVDLRDHPLQRDHWWGSPEFEAAYGPLAINEILARIGADLGITADFSAPVPLAATPPPDVSGCVLLIAETDGVAKQWPAARWTGLADSIQAAGAPVRLITRDGIPAVLAGCGLREVRAPTPGDAVDVLSGCRAVVGVDTGLTHVAAQQGTPTVTVCRPPAVYFRAWPHTRVVTGRRCDDACVAAEAAYAYHDRVSLRGFRPERAWTCAAAAGCLEAIELTAVFAALTEIW